MQRVTLATKKYDVGAIGFLSLVALLSEGYTEMVRAVVALLVPEGMA